MVLLHLGHLGSPSLTIIYIRQREHPTSTMEMSSGLRVQPRLLFFLLLLLLLSSWLSSLDTHELDGDVGGAMGNRVGESGI